MKFCGVLLSLWAVQGVLLAQGDIKYVEVGGTLVLAPDVSSVPKPVNSIRWKYGTKLVVDWSEGSPPTYFGGFRDRAQLNTKSLQLDINNLKLADSGEFSLETNNGLIKTQNVQIIKRPPKPVTNPQPLLCVPQDCSLNCTADIKDLGPVTYEWKKNEGDWSKGDELKHMMVTRVVEYFSCRLITSQSTSEASESHKNPLYRSDPVLIVVIVVILSLVILAVAVVCVLVKFFPELTISKKIKKTFDELKKCICPNSQPDGTPAETPPPSAVRLLSSPPDSNGQPAGHSAGQPAGPSVPSGQNGQAD